MEKISPLEAARYFKYLLQYKLSYIVVKMELRRVQAKSFYCKYKKYFDFIVDFCNKYNIDVFKYIDFFINVYNKLERNIASDLVSMKTMNAFIVFLQEDERKDKVFRWFMKSANNIASDCILLDYFTTKDYLRYLIKSGKLANYYLTGKISKYWLSAIPSFKTILSKLDLMTKDELKDIYDKFDIYNTEINEAFLKIRKCKVNPIKFTDELIFKKRNFPS